MGTFIAVLLIAVSLGVGLSYVAPEKLKLWKTRIAEFSKRTFIALRRQLKEDLTRMKEDAFQVARLVKGKKKTFRRRMAEALRQSAAEIQDLYDHAPCGYHSLDKEGVIIQINQTEVQWLGYSREELIGKKHFAELLSPQSLGTFRNYFHRLMTQGQIRDLELEMICKDGSLRFVLLCASAVFDKAGKFLICRVILNDITPLKRTQETVDLLSFILNHLPEAGLLIDQEGAFKFANEQSCRILGYSQQELLSMRVWDISGSIDSQRWPNYWADIKAQRAIHFAGSHRTNGARLFLGEVTPTLIEVHGRAFALGLVRENSAHATLG